MSNHATQPEGRQLVRQPAPDLPPGAERPDDGGSQELRLRRRLASTDPLPVLDPSVGATHSCESAVLIVQAA
jgi:hypothetical protein